MRTRMMIVLAAALVLTSCSRSLEAASGSTTAGPTTAPTVPPDPTTATSAVPATPPPSVPTTPNVPTTPPPTATVVETPPRPGPDPGVAYEMWTTAQFGDEPVRGSGCGADGSLGDVMPDGLWYGYVQDWTSTSFQFDVVCVYYGDSAVPFRDACYDGDESELDVCLNRELDFWVENNNPRTRTVPFSPDIEFSQRDAASCPEFNLTASTSLALIHIVNGQAAYLNTHCPGG